MLRPLTALILAALASALLTGCYSPGGGVFPRSGGGMTYYSTENTPTTITLVDTRSGEELFTLDIPIGKQFVVDFDDGEGDDPEQTPDLMRYQIFDIGTSIGSLENSMTVPNRFSRRLDITIRDVN